jgi:SH3 domain-containing protein
MRSDKSCSRPKAQAYQLLSWVTLLALLGLSMTACNVLPKLPTSGISATSPVSCEQEQHEIERLQELLAEKEAQQHEIERLQKLLAENEAQIRSQQVRQQDQAKALQETTSQAARAQVKLRRLATRPAAASTIAEAEVAMENLKLSQFAESEQSMQTQAQRLLNAAAVSYVEDNYVAAMDYAAHARGFIDMIENNRTFKMADPRRLTVPFSVPIPMRVRSDSNLRQKPSESAAILGLLKKDSTITAEAYRGDWLHVQTADGRSGWVLNTLVEAQVGKP